MKKDLIKKMNEVESLFKTLVEVKTDELNWRSEYLFVLENRLDKSNQNLEKSSEDVLERGHTNEL